MKYDVIIADPPWSEGGGGKIKRGADRHYPLMRTKDIVCLGGRVRSAVADDALLFLWVTNNFLPDGLAVMEAWGFTYVTNIAWHKSGNVGLGQYVRMAHELCLIGRRGKTLPAYKAKERIRYPSVIHSPRGRHSEKPAAIFEIAESFTDGAKLEIFSRSRRLGWDAWGDEVGVQL